MYNLMGIWPLLEELLTFEPIATLRYKRAMIAKEHKGAKWYITNPNFELKYLKNEWK